MNTPSPRSPRSRRPVRLIVGGLLVLAIAGVALTLVFRAILDPGDPVGGVTEVSVRDSEFDPAAVEVPAGSTLTWNWEGEEEHNVIGDAFESPNQVTGEFAHTFTEPGTYSYRCTLHYFMRGEVVVTDRDSAWQE
ncbi:MAG: cupredoxin domain-containing protein [Chloroflexota bacterium]|nr:cupredoxin domain-containing protein [Chloroflexota bacterium]